jgi:putative peptidoglycan lipid II flippase
VTVARRAFVAVVLVALAGNLVALGYEVLAARRFGTGPDADALALTLVLTLAISNEIVTWIGSLFVPFYVETRTLDGPTAGRRFVAFSTAALTIGVATLALAMAVGAGGVVALIAPTLPARDEATRLLRLFAPLLVLLPLVALLAGALQAHGRFVVAVVRQLLWYGGAVALLIVFGARYGPVVVPIGMGAGLTTCAVIFGVTVARTLPSGPERVAVGRRLRRAAWSLAPLALASAANYANVTIERAIAARLPEGSLAALTYAYRLLNFPIALMLANATTMLLPDLSARAALADTGALERTIGRALRLAIVFTLPIAALSIALAEPLVRVLFEREAFTRSSTILTVTALTWYAPGVVGLAGMNVLARSYQALREIGRIAMIGVLTSALNIAMMATLTVLIGFRGLPLAVSVSMLGAFVLMLLGLRARVPGFRLASIATSGGRALLASGCAMAAAWGVRSLVSDAPLPALLGGGIVGLAAYAMVLALVSADDVHLALAVVSPSYARRPRPVP